MPPVSDDPAFVTCKGCNAEVSAFVTECPYCGARLRKRAPKLDSGAITALREDDGNVRQLPRRRSRPQRDRRSQHSHGRSLPQRGFGIKPYVSAGLFAVGVVVLALCESRLVNPRDLAWDGSFDAGSWRLLTAPFAAFAFGGQIVALIAVFAFGALLERRVGWPATLLAFVVGGAVGAGVAGVIDVNQLVAGANGAALAIFGLWLVLSLLERGSDSSALPDPLGAVFCVLLLLLLPLADTDLSLIAGIAGLLTGAVLGLIAWPLAARKQA